MRTALCTAAEHELRLLQLLRLVHKGLYSIETPAHLHVFVVELHHLPHERVLHAAGLLPGRSLACRGQAHMTTRLDVLNAAMSRDCADGRGMIKNLHKQPNSGNHRLDLQRTAKLGTGCNLYFSHVRG